jgi:hypothetical protein|tara:strand:- start:177 stop:374 length:198 start_codon:yes stop_codon:yes gene_type:complete
MTLLHEFFGSEGLSNRVALVFVNDDKSYTVIMLQDEAIIEERVLKEHSEQYAEDCAENWVMGVMT